MFASRQVLLPALMGVVGLFGVGCSSYDLGEENTSLEQQLFGGGLSALTQTDDGSHTRRYQPRGDLVVPPSTAGLPAPRDNVALAVSNWPDDPDVARARKAEEDLSLTVDERRGYDMHSGRPEQIISYEERQRHRVAGAALVRSADDINPDNYGTRRLSPAEMKRLRDQYRAQNKGRTREPVIVNTEVNNPVIASDYYVNRNQQGATHQEVIDTSQVGSGTLSRGRLTDPPESVQQVARVPENYAGSVDADVPSATTQKKKRWWPF